LEFLNTHAEEFGLSNGDLFDPIVTSQYTDPTSGNHYLYLRQQVNGLAVINAEFSIGIAPNGSVISAGGGFVSNLSAQMQGQSLITRLSPIEAIHSASLGLGLELEGQSTIRSPRMGPFQFQETSYSLTSASVSLDDIPVQLLYVPTADGSATLAWQLVLRTPDGEHWYNVSVDSATGEVVALSDWIDHASYQVLPLPHESPQDGGFAVLSNPHDPTASPFGWHDTNGVAGHEFTDTRGNNVDAHLDRDANNTPDANPPRSNGGPNLDFSGYTFDPTQVPTTLQNQNAAMVNLFYVNNWLHDVHYKYGFTEPAGNFQLNNYGNGGAGNDAVQADAQDGSGTNNANFGTPVDGLAPRMQMYLWTAANPDRDSDLDNGVIIHEYGHGVSNRLTGGPANSDALDNIQSGGMGEGWSDYYALMFTQRASDPQNGSNGIGTYVTNQPQSGVGIRIVPYSFDMSINPLTWDAYGTSGTTPYGITRSTAVHRTGTIWASALWDMNWLLINKYGFDGNEATGWSPNPGPANAGNKLALRLVMDAMKIQPANPSFTQARDAIVAADIALTGGNNLYEIWAAFARRGLGQGSSTPGSTSTATPTLSTTLPMLVQSVGPGQGNVVTTAPANYTLNVTSPIDPASLQASDFVVNGQPATGVSYTPGLNTVTFTFTVSPVSAEGPQTIQIASGAFTRASDGSPVAAFSSTFYLDATPLLVTSISPTPGSAVSLPLTTIDVNLNQAINPASVQNSDLTISKGSVTGFTLLNGNTTVRFTVANLISETTMDVSVAAGAFLDAQSNPSALFAGGTYDLDYGVFPFPTPLAAQNPLGSLAYEGAFSATIGFAGDTDSFTITLDAPQVLNVSVTPHATLQPSLTVTGPGTNQSVSAAGAGAAAQLNAISITTAGTYTFIVGGVANTIGTFAIRPVLNASTEAELIGGPTNNTTGTAQNLATTLLNLGGGVSSATIRGQTEVSPAALVNEVEPNGTTATANSGATYFAAPNNNLYHIGISGTISSGTDADYFNIGQLQVGDVITLTESGAPSLRGTNTNTLVRLYRGGSTSIIASDDDSGPGLDALLYRFTVTTADTYYVRAHRLSSTNTGSYQLGIWLENSGTAPNTGGTFTAEVESNNTVGTANNASNAWRPLSYFASAAGSITAGDTDIFSYQFTAGDLVTIVTDSISGLIPQAALLNTAGTTIATEDGSSSVGGSGGFSPIYSYVIPTTGTYYFRVTGGSGSTGSYSANVFLATTASLPTVPLGQDLYSFTLAAGQSASAIIDNLSPGTVEIAFLDIGGGVVATGVAGPTNFDAIVANFIAPAAGTYFLRVTGAPGIDYQATVVTGGTFDAEPNNSFGTAQQLATGISAAALGSISGNDDWFQVTLAAGESITLSTATPGGGPGEIPNNLDPAIELYDPSNALVGGDDNSAPDGRNATLTRTASVAGSFRVRVMPAGGTSGEYVLRSLIAPSGVPSVTGTQINDGAAQRSRVTSITVTFSTVVTFLGGNVVAAFTLTRIGGGSVAFSASASNATGVTVVTINGFTGAEAQSGSLRDGRFTLTALASNISNAAGQLNGGTNFTFGDAQGLFRFYGDINGDRNVDISDFGPFSGTFGLNSGQAGFISAFDFNNDGTIDITDFGQLSIRIFTVLP
jgi:extracellular elastinolytic metalloproteinase